MSGLSKLTGGIFLPLCCCTGWGSIEEGASRHAFTLANRSSAQWQNLALGLRFHCVLVGGEQLGVSHSEGRVHVRTLGCPPLLRPDCVIMSSQSLWHGLRTRHHVGLRRMCSSWKIGGKIQVFLISSSFSAEAHTPQIISYLVYVSLKVCFFSFSFSISLLLLGFTEDSV